MAESVETGETYKGDFYCVKCKEKREAEGRVVETNGRRMAKGFVPRVRHQPQPHPRQGLIHRTATGRDHEHGSGPALCSVPGRPSPCGRRRPSAGRRVPESPACTSCPTDTGGSRMAARPRLKPHARSCCGGARRAAGRAWPADAGVVLEGLSEAEMALVARLDGSLDLPALDALAARTGVAPGRVRGAAAGAARAAPAARPADRPRLPG